MIIAIFLTAPIIFIATSQMQSPLSAQIICSSKIFVTITDGILLNCDETVCHKLSISHFILVKSLAFLLPSSHHTISRNHTQMFPLPLERHRKDVWGRTTKETGACN